MILVPARRAVVIDYLGVAGRDVVDEFDPHPVRA